MPCAPGAACRARTRRCCSEGIEALGLITNKRKKVVPQNHIWQLPARYVGPYAEADAVNTLAAVRETSIRSSIAKARAPPIGSKCDLLPMVLEMRLRGIRIDLDAAERARDLLLRKRDAVFAELSEKLGMPSRHGRDRPQQMAGRDLRPPRHQISAHREGQSVVHRPARPGGCASIAHWLPQLIAKADKYNNAAAKFLQNYILDHVVNGRIHAEIHPHRSEDSGTKSFRFSYSDPPLQQMPSRDEELAPLIRGVFLPEEGEVWAKPDASQQEFRLVVHYADAAQAAQGAQKPSRAIATIRIPTFTRLPRR